MKSPVDLNGTNIQGFQGPTGRETVISRIQWYVDRVRSGKMRMHEVPGKYEETVRGIIDGRIEWPPPEWVNDE